MTDFINSPFKVDCFNYQYDKLYSSYNDVVESHYYSFKDDILHDFYFGDLSKFDYIGIYDSKEYEYTFYYKNSHSDT